MLTRQKRKNKEREREKKKDFCQNSGSLGIFKNTVAITYLLELSVRTALLTLVIKANTINHLHSTIVYIPNSVAYSFVQKCFITEMYV
jgi:hypothetical protein